ncbi:uncharacterized protein BDV17DRAFT_265650 [Aspergillus undulatus]|uniref:uncharacterized protein n=1 Tax=Aspergillus undulatus TaxID=1810928 RepID=UPI003CCE10F4
MSAFLSLPCVALVHVLSYYIGFHSCILTPLISCCFHCFSFSSFLSRFLPCLLRVPLAAEALLLVILVLISAVFVVLVSPSLTNTRPFCSPWVFLAMPLRPRSLLMTRTAFNVPCVL